MSATPTTAFSFLKTLVQTRARGHTATGAVCYRFGLAAASTLAHPVRRAPTQAEREAHERAENERLAKGEVAASTKRHIKRKKAKGPRRRPAPYVLVRTDPPRAYDYRGRVGITASGAALPEGAAAQWGDPLEWARRVEAADGKRLDSRQCRDDVVGIPLELLDSGFADLAIARQADKLAKLHHTPVHWVIHKPHGASLNWHAHMLYAGRKLSPDGQEFDRRRDVDQDKPELIEDHKSLWAGTCRELGVEIAFALSGQAIEDAVREEFATEHGPTPTDDDEVAIQAEKRKRWREHREATPAQSTLTPKVLRAERDAVAEEEGHRLDAVLQAAGGAPLTAHDRRELGRISSDVEDLDTTQLLALDRAPVTTTARIAKYGRPPPAPSPASYVEPPRPEAVPVIVAPLVASRALPRPQPVVNVGVAPRRPAPARQAALAPPNSFEYPVPLPRNAHRLERPRPVPARAVTAPPVPAHALPQPHAASAIRTVCSTPLLSQAGLRREVPVAAQRIVRPPRPVLRAEEALPAPAHDQRPVAAVEVIHAAPEPPWRRRLRQLVRRLRQTVTEWWPWAPAPPRPARRVKARVPKSLRRRRARPVPAQDLCLEVPDRLPRPMPARRPFLLQHPDRDDFDPVTRTVTPNARFREQQARARARAHTAPRRKAAPSPKSVQTPNDRPRPKQREGYDDGIGY